MASDLIGYEAFEFAYIDVSAFFAEYTVAFALALMSADTSAYGGKIASVVNDLEGVAEVAFGEFGNPLGDVVAYRAAFLALGHLAVQAALGFPDSFGECVVFRYFFEIVHNYMG